jgi:hypothetical protein
MLQILRNFETETGLAVRPRRVRHHVSITVAKARHYQTHGRADLAARWLTGTLTIKPTRSLAAHIFNVYSPQIQAALDELEATTVAPAPIDSVWNGMAPADKAGFGRNHLPEIWTQVDLVTAA